MHIYISLLGPELNACREGIDLVGVTSIAIDQYLPYKHSVPALIRRCDDLPATM